MKILRSERPTRTLKGFKIYLREISSYARLRKLDIESSKYKTEEDIDEYAYVLSLIEKGDSFLKELNENEIAAIEYCRYHAPNKACPHRYEESLARAFNKWCDIFFPDGQTLPDIDYKLVGKIMEFYRRESLKTKTELGRIFGINRTTITHYEEGTRKPSLDYIYKFSKLFGCSIDELLSLKGKIDN